MTISHIAVQSTAPMDVATAPPLRSAPPLAWLTPWRCRIILVLLIALNFFASWRYLTHDCPIDLSGDEAQYWDWSRHLDLSYYSKGPLVAYLIRASCFFLGDTMPAVRLPALVLAMGTALCTYWLTRRLFGSDRLALGAVAMAAIVPIYSAGSMLMTIDPPFFFFWALATCLAVAAIFDDRNWAWPAAGLVAGLGVLTKYAMLEWPAFVLLFLAIDRPCRAKLKTAGPWIMTAIAVACLAPILIWNAGHEWVSFHHVSGQIGAHGSGGNTIAFLLSQFAAINPFIAGLMIAAVVDATRSEIGNRFSDGPEGRVSELNPPNHSTPGAVAKPLQEIDSPLANDGAVNRRRREMRYLICIGAPFFLFCLGDSFISKVQANWPAPAYFTLLILMAHFIAVRWRDVRGWFIGAVICGLIMQLILHDMTQLYPLVGWIDRTFPHWTNREGQPAVRAKTVDLEYKLRGIRDPFAKTVAEDLQQLPADSFVLTEAYEDASVLAFYLPGQPKTYFAGSYWTEPFPIRRRWTQFDIWPDRALDRPELRGKDCIYIGTMIYAPLAKSFDSVQRLSDIVVRVRGLEVTRFEVWKCMGFKGMKRPPGEGPR